MKRFTLVFVIVVAVIGGAFYIWSATAARKKSNDILSKFKEIDKQIKASNDSIGSQNEIAYKNHAIIPLIDSLITKYREMPDTDQPVIPSTQMQLDLKRLLNYIQDENKFRWNLVDSWFPDTISYWPGSKLFDEQKWLSDFLINQPKVVSITYLNYLRNQAVAKHY